LVGSEVGGKSKPREVRLKEDVRLEVRALVVDRRKLDGTTVVHPAKKRVLVVTNGDVLEFGGGRDDLEETLELRLLREGHREDVDGDVVDVVVRRDHTEVERRNVHCSKSKVSEKKEGEIRRKENALSSSTVIAFEFCKSASVVSTSSER
jgi:hypothetical protein